MKELSKAKKIMEAYFNEQKGNKKENTKTFAQHLDKRYGKTGTKERTDFEIEAKSFAIGELIKEERKLANLTQEQLAEKI